MGGGKVIRSDPLSPQGENKRQNPRALRQLECPVTTGQIRARFCLNEELFLPGRHGRNKPPAHPPSNGRVENHFWRVGLTPSSRGGPIREVGLEWRKVNKRVRYTNRSIIEPLITVHTDEHG